MSVSDGEQEAAVPGRLRDRRVIPHFPHHAHSHRGHLARRHSVAGLQGHLPGLDVLLLARDREPGMDLTYFCSSLFNFGETLSVSIKLI